MGELVFIGLGLRDEGDMSRKAVDAALRCDSLFAEFYTSVHECSDVKRLEGMFGKKVEVLGREAVESGERIMAAARSGVAGFLVPGDPMTATTHIELRLRAEKEGIRTRVVHGTSILSAAAGLLGLQSYKFGRTTTIPFKRKGFEPRSPYEVIRQNRAQGLHTLALLDIDEGERRTLRADEALGYLLEIESVERGGVVTEGTLACVVADAGSDEPLVRTDLVGSLVKERLGNKVQTLVFPGKLHFMEAEALQVLAHAPKDIERIT